MEPKLKRRFSDLIAGTVIFGGCAALVAAYQFGLPWLAGETDLPPPGWDCAAIYSDPESGRPRGECRPLAGWHFEEDVHQGRIAVHNVVATQRDRQRDIDTAGFWAGLSNDERRSILSGSADIYKYRSAKNSN